MTRRQPPDPDRPVVWASIAAAIALAIIAGCGGGGDEQDGAKSIDPPNCQQTPRPPECQ